MTSDELPPPIALVRMATGHYVSGAVHVAAALGIADLLGEGPRHYAELAKATGTHAPTGRAGCGRSLRGGRRRFLPRGAGRR